MNFTGPNPLHLDNIRNALIRLEDTIIFGLIERAQFAHNPRMYTKKGFADVLHTKAEDAEGEGESFNGSWLEWFLNETERSHAKVRRYDSPDEHPFTPHALLPKPILPPISYPALLYPNNINVNPQILEFYIKSIVPTITKTVTREIGSVDGELNDDGNYGSSATRDVECLQAISRRIHCGMFVSESKFLSAPASFVPHILNPNPQALLDLITKPAVEAALLIRLEKKAKWYGMELVLDEKSGELVPKEGGGAKVKVDEVVRLYRDYIIPLTKEVEVEYLLHRLDGLSPKEIQALQDS